jgi:putative membrane protein
VPGRAGGRMVVGPDVPGATGRERLTRVNWWCTAIREPWSWTWRAYPGVWIVLLSLLVPYVVAVRRRAATGRPDPKQRRKTIQFVSGIVLLWLSLDWPVGLLGTSYLASVHMLMFMVITQVAAPLLLLGTPEWMARRITAKLRLNRALRKIARPLPAGILYNVVLIGTQTPLVVDALRPNPVGSMVLDLIWLLGGMVLWLPLVSPLPELRMASYPGRMVYLFLAAAALPLVPGGFLTFSSYPLYSIYELAPRVFDGLSALDDQQLAGAVMKVGSLPVVWPVIFVLFLQWANAERGGPAPRVRPPRPPRPVTQP